MPPQFLKDYIPWQGPHVGARERCEEEEAVKRSCYAPTTKPLLHPPGREGEEVAELERKNDVEPGKKVGPGGRSCFNFVFVSHHPTLF